MTGSLAPVPAPPRQGRGHEKFSFRKNPRNSLKSLDSDERIQGNPRKTNPDNQGFSRQNGPCSRKPKSAPKDKILQLNCAPSRSIVGRNAGKEVAIIATSSTVIGSRLASPMMRKLIAIR